jgi:5-formyltetrahydrofolate cyclo-ligase
MTNSQIKKSLRQSSRAIRDGFGEEFIKGASQRACELLLSIDEFKEADTLLLYYPIKNEISPLSLIGFAQKCGKQIAFPVCNADNDTLDFYTVNSIDELSPSSFGISEPIASENAAILTDKTLCLVPGLLFSKGGHRLGYGKGFYDKFLKNFKGLSVGFSYSELLVDNIPTESSDIPLNIIITEKEVLRFAKEN